MKRWIAEVVEEKKSLLAALEDCGYLPLVETAGGMMADALGAGKKILLAGNGGSAADAQHFAGEIVGRFTMERRSLPALSLCTDPSVVTCIGNDYGYDAVFSRQVEGLGNEGDIFVGISTSGNSANIIKAVAAAKGKGMKSVGLLGRNGGKIRGLCDIALVVPTDSTPRIQEVHTFTVHLLCEYIERTVFGMAK